jgi:hypothetical protein
LQERKKASIYYINIMSSTKPTSSASISDLAPFVAAVLKDKTVMDLNKDIEELREELREESREREKEILLVEVTGRGGTPVHYQASLIDGETDLFKDDLWNVYFEQKKYEFGEDIVLPLNLIKDLEVRLGGIVVLDMEHSSNDTYDEGYNFSENEEDPQICDIYVEYLDKPISPIVESVNCSVGPVLYEDYIFLIQANFGDLTDALTNGFPDRFNKETPVNLIIDGVTFKKGKIGYLLSIVERMNG